MTATRRWCVVALGVAILVSLPIAINSRTARDSAANSKDLLSMAQRSAAVSYSGLVEAAGSLQLPVSDQFTEASDVFGERTTMRVWWRGDDDWRVNQLGVAGETDVVHDSRGTTIWNYESNHATKTPNTDIRLPRASDLLPPALAQRLLEDAEAAEVNRIPAERVAGIDAPGLRLDPSAHQSSIDHVDVWLDPDSGLPVRVSIFGASAEEPAVTTTFLDVAIARPSESSTAFSPPAGADSHFEDFVDIADAANHFAPVTPPRLLAGLHRRDSSGGAVGAYGSGATFMIALPLWDQAACPLREQLAVTPGSGVSRLGMTLAVGPLNLLLTETSFQDHSWLFVGTVTPETLDRATQQMLARPRTFGHRVVTSGPR
ncbi:MAG: hypothetical protein WKF82_06375 [Nocardioidaceae bacterium]